MWMDILITTVKSSLVKRLIALGIKMLLKHKEDGITKDIAEVILDGIAESRLNNATFKDIEALKKVL